MGLTFHRSMPKYLGLIQSPRPIKVSECPPATKIYWDLKCIQGWISIALHLLPRSPSGSVSHRYQWYIDCKVGWVFSYQHHPTTILNKKPSWNSLPWVLSKGRGFKPRIFGKLFFNNRVICLGKLWPTLAVWAIHPQTLTHPLARTAPIYPCPYPDYPIGLTWKKIVVNFWSLPWVFLPCS